MSRSLIFLGIIAILSSLILIPSPKVSAQDEVGTFVANCFDSGEDPIPICTCVDMNQTRDNMTANYQLQNDIDCSDTVNWDSGAGWTAIAGSYGGRYYGTFEGQNFNITSLYINRGSTIQGLIGYTDADANITTFKLVNSSINGTTHLAGAVVYSYGDISYVTFEGNITGTGGTIGGIVAVNDGSVTYCRSKVNITGAGGSIGGIMGDSLDSSTLLEYCYSEGHVEGTGQAIGGFAGRNYGTIRHCYTRVNVTSSNIGIGGFVGTNHGAIQKSYSMGYVDGSNPYYTYGFSPCSSAGCSVSTCYWDSQTSGIATTGDYGRGTPKTTAQMTNVSTYTTSSAWDFQDNPNNDAANDDYWGIDTTINDGYPSLVGVGIGEFFLTPTTTLNDPSAGHYITGPTTVTFNCSVSSSNPLSNISLYITNSSNTSFALNQTTNLSGTDNSTTWDLNLSAGNHTWNCISSDNTNRFDWDNNRSVVLDDSLPTFTTFANQTLSSGTALGYDIDASDTGSGVSCFDINNTADFSINCSGYLQNNTDLAIGINWLNITVNDSAGNNNSGLMFVNITPVSTVELSVITPTNNLNVAQNEFFKVEVNVTCNTADCGEVNVTLDPEVGYGDESPYNTGTSANSCKESGSGTVDTCADGSVCTYPFKIEKIFIEDMNDTTFSGGDTVNVTITTNTGCCSPDAVWIYSNETTGESNFRNMGVLANIGNGLRNYSKTFVLDNVVGNHTIRAVNIYSAASGSLLCGADESSGATYSDTDDVIIYVDAGTKGVISTDSTATPFYTNVTNPTNISLDMGESEVVTWWVNASGSARTDPYTFFAYANLTSDMTITNTSSKWNVTISTETTFPTFDLVSPTPDNKTQTTNTSVELNFSITELNVDEINYNWNGTNYTLYNDSLVFMANFDNLTALGENDTHIFDISSSGKNGTGYNGVLWNSTGKHGGCFEFDGTDDYIQVKSFDMAETDFSVLLWFRTTNSTSSIFVASKDENWGYHDRNLYLEDGKLKFRLWTEETIATTDTYNDGEWHQLVALVDSSEGMILYVDGVFKVNGSKTSSDASESNDIRIGQTSFASFPIAAAYFNGSIDEVKIWNRVLTEEEIYQEYISNFKKIDSDTWEYYINQSKNITNVLTDATYTYYVHVKDDSSNENMTKIRAVTVYSDTNSPNISLFFPTNNTGSPVNLSFFYNVTDASDFSNCSLILNGFLNQTNASAVTKGVSLNFTENNLSVDNYNWSINCTDLYNNIGASETRLFSVVQKTNFLGNTTNLTQVNISNISNFIIDSPGYGDINFTQNIDLSTGGDINEYVNISFNWIEINTSILASLNRSAKLALYNLTFTTPQLLRDSEACPSTICTQESYSGGTLTFDVTSFSVYSARETPTNDTNATDSSSSSSSSSSSTTSTDDGGILDECETDGDCDEGYTCYENECVKLFDVEILEVEPLIGSLSFELEYLVKGMANVSGDVIIKFWIDDGDDEIMLGQDTIYLGYFEEKTKTTTLNLPYGIDDNSYDLYVQANFEDYSAESFRIINIFIPEEILAAPELEEEEEEETISQTSEETSYWPWIIVILVIFAIIFIYWVYKDNKVKEEEEPKELTPQTPRLAVIEKPFPPLNDLLQKMVYTDSGEHLGEVYEVILGENKVEKLKIRLGSKYNHKIKGIIIKYINVKDVGDIVIVEEAILDQVKNLMDQRTSESQEESTQ